MANRRFVKKHNYLVNLHPAEDASEHFHPVINLLRNSRINYVLTRSPVLYLDYLRQFYSSAILMDEGQIPFIRARVAEQDFEFTASDLREILHLGTVEQEDGPTVYSQAFRMGAFQRMGYVGDPAKNLFFKADIIGRWRYLSTVVLMCLSNKKAGWDTLSVETQSQVLSLVYNKPYSFSQYFFNQIKNQLVEPRHRFLMHPRIIMMIINARLPNLPAGKAHDIVSVIDKRLFKDSLIHKANRAVRPVERDMFGALVNPLYVAPPNDGWLDVPVDQPEGNVKQDVVAGAGEAVVQPQAPVQALVQAPMLLPPAAMGQDLVIEPQVAPAQNEQAELINQVLDQVGGADVNQDVDFESVFITANELASDEDAEDNEPGPDAGKNVDDSDSHSDSDGFDPNLGYNPKCYVRVGSRNIPRRDVKGKKKRKTVDDDEDYRLEDELKKIKRLRRAHFAGTKGSGSGSGSGSKVAETVSKPVVILDEEPAATVGRVVRQPVATVTVSQSVPTPAPAPFSTSEGPSVASTELPESIRLPGLELQVKVLTARLNGVIAENEKLKKRVLKQNATLTAVRTNYDIKVRNLESQVAELTKRLDQQPPIQEFGRFDYNVEKMSRDLSKVINRTNLIDTFCQRLAADSVKVANAVRQRLERNDRAIIDLESNVGRQKSAIISNHDRIDFSVEILRRMAEELASQGLLSETCKDDIFRGPRKKDEDDDSNANKEGEIPSSLTTLGFIISGSTTQGESSHRGEASEKGKEKVVVDIVNDDVVVINVCQTSLEIIVFSTLIHRIKTRFELDIM